MRRLVLVVSIALLGLSAGYLLYEYVRLAESYTSAVMV